MKFSFIITLLSISLNVISQEINHCGSGSYEAMLRKKFPTLNENEKKYERILSLKNNLRTSATVEEEILTIPVVVHVLYNTASSNISDELIHSQIQVLNEDYRRLNLDTTETPEEFKHFAADIKIQFCLAKRDPQGNVTDGIIRKKISQQYFNGFENYENDTLMKSLSHWPNDQYLNIWVTNLTSTSGGNTLGYAMNPSSTAFPDLNNAGVSDKQDGVVIHYNYFGVISRTGKYNKGRTATHEVGHWLGLKHIWGDTYCGEDFISDTPPQEESNKDISTTTCLHQSNCNNVLTRDMSANFMDYSPDQCMNIFTTGQKNRMRTVLETNPRRNALKNSAGCCAPDNVVSLPFFEGFEVDNSNIKVTNPDLDNTWIKAPFGGFGQSYQSFSIVNNTSTVSHSDMFETPSIDFVNSSNPVLEFSLATALSADDQTSDSLVLLYNPNCSGFIPFKTYSRLELSAAVKSGFSPQKEDWKKLKVDLKEFAGKKISQIQFKNYSQGKNNLFIDDINIYNSTDELDVSVFPNPANTEVNVLIKYKEPALLNFAIYNSVGEKMEENNIDTPDFRKTVNVSGFASGLYIIEATIDGQHVIKKFIVAR